MFDTKFQQKYSNVLRWFKTCMFQPQFLDALEKQPEFATAEKQAPKAAKAGAAAGSDKKQDNKKPADQKKPANPAAPKSPVAEAKKEKPKNPLNAPWSPACRSMPYVLCCWIISARVVGCQQSDIRYFL